MHRSSVFPVLFVLVSLFAAPTWAQQWPVVSKVERQPLVSATERLVSALDLVGRPLNKEQLQLLTQLKQNTDDAAVVEAVQKMLDPLCLAAIHVNPESRVKVAEGPAPKQLIENGWQTFLVKIHNEAGINPPLNVSSPQARPQFIQSDFSHDPEEKITEADVKDRWLNVEIADRPPMKKSLSGLLVEYQIVQLYSRDAGRREATLQFDIGQGTQDLGFRNEVAILFDCLAAQKVTLNVTDPEEEGSDPMVGIVIRDKQGRVYPNPARRLAPDFFFHNQIYRKTGESISLPSGTYDVRITRGPEYLPIDKELVVGDKPTLLNAELQRWIQPIECHWYSGDHHIHAAGCSHYQNPTKGVGPDDMMRHVLGEDLKVGCVLSWGPCWYEQKKNFAGKISLLSTPNYLMRYDVEVSGFPSSHAGHLCLLQLAEDDFPGTTRIEEWPTWTLPVLKWGKRQGGVVGYSHSGWGLTLPDYKPDGTRAEIPRNQFEAASGGRAADKLPDYAMPRFDGIGANEYIVAVTHDACDFISAVDTPAVWELNIWYHALNCGFRTRISGETDFPCIYDDRVGLGRSYVQFSDVDELSFENWVAGLKDGRSYCGDGKSHITGFVATRTKPSENRGLDFIRLGFPNRFTEKISQLDLEGAEEVTFNSSVAAMLDEEQSPLGKDIQSRRLDMKPYWHIERCRIEGTRKVKAELIVNGEPVQSKEIVADGDYHDCRFTHRIEKSSWVALRIFPSLHTNPIWVEVGGKPVRANAKSARWCREAVDVCWESKKNQIRDSEKESAKAAYDHARKTFEQIAEEFE